MALALPVRDFDRWCPVKFHAISPVNPGDSVIAIGGDNRLLTAIFKSHGLLVWIEEAIHQIKILTRSAIQLTHHILKTRVAAGHDHTTSGVNSRGTPQGRTDPQSRTLMFLHAVTQGYAVSRRRRRVRVGIQKIIESWRRDSRRRTVCRNNLGPEPACL